MDFFFFFWYVCLSHLWSSSWSSRSQIRMSHWFCASLGRLAGRDQWTSWILAYWSFIPAFTSTERFLLIAVELLWMVGGANVYCHFLVIYLHRGCHPEVFQNSAFIVLKQVSSSKLSVPILAKRKGDLPVQSLWAGCWTKLASPDMCPERCALWRVLAQPSPQGQNGHRLTT